MTAWLWAFAVAFAVASLCGCSGKPLVQGALEPGGTIYRETEQEPWGSRTTVKVEGFQF